MITFKQHIEESLLTPHDIMRARGTTTNVYKVITSTKLKQLLDAIGNLRGIFKDGALLVWAASDAIHQDFESAFGKGTHNLMIYKAPAKRVQWWKTTRFFDGDPRAEKLQKILGDLPQKERRESFD